MLENLTIRVNGETLPLKATLSIQDLMASLGQSLQYAAVALNGEVIPKNNIGTTLLQDGDKVEILTPVAGG